MTVHVSFDSYLGAQVPKEMMPEVLQRCKQDAARMPCSPAHAPRLSLHFSSRQAVVKRAGLLRKLQRVAPSVLWEECAGIEIACRGDLSILDSALRSCIVSVSMQDAPCFLDEARSFRRLTRIGLTFTQFQTLCRDREVSLPQVQRLKMECRDAAFCDGELCSISEVFPGVSRLHLALLPIAFPVVCGPDFVAPPNFRLTLLQDADDMASRSVRDASVFVASHLLSLPFHWRGKLFSQVVRLQMNELNADHQGKSTEQLVDLLVGMPLLRRVGTLSLRTAMLFDFLRANCQLEELVMVLEIDEVERMFKPFLVLESELRHCSLKRLAVHLVASDGVSRLKSQKEEAICAGWLQVALLLQPSGFVAFSAGSHQILETVPFQLPWFDPQRFSFDMARCLEPKLPCSTPLGRPLPYHTPEFLKRPSGALVAGSMRPQSQVSWLGPNNSQHVGNVQSLLQSPSVRRGGGGGGFGDASLAWVGWHLNDAIKVLDRCAKEDKL
mmetsp:Transcript_115056/g.372137  ORF Transcript_115056/g.372137 Transcript_115056/m.372137 type:complete len:497 (+) Transcript_115056:1832-3322(+)